MLSMEIRSLHYWRANQIMKTITKGRTPSKLYQQPLCQRNINGKTPGKRLFSTSLSTVKKLARHTICTPTKHQKLNFDVPLNSTCVRQRPVPSVQDFFHPDNFSEAIEMIRDVPEPAHRESITSLASTNLNVSSSTNIVSCRPSTETPLPLMLTPQSVSNNDIIATPVVGVSPLMHRLEDLLNTKLEAMLNDTFEKLCETMMQNQTMNVTNMNDQPTMLQSGSRELLHAEINDEDQHKRSLLKHTD